MKISFATIKRRVRIIAAPLIERHAVIFIVISLLFLMAIVYSIQSILTVGDDTEYRQKYKQQNTVTEFDEETIKKVQQLQYRKNALKPVLPGSGRINPFSE